LALGVAAVAAVLADPVERVEADSAVAVVGAADSGEPVGELVCGPPVATPTPGTPERVRLTSPARNTEAAGPVRVDSVVDEVSPPGLLTAISPGGFSGLRSRLGASCVGVDKPDDDVSDAVDPDSGDELDGDRGSDGELLLESAGSASATPGVLATPIPTPSATANAPTRPMYFALRNVIPSPICPAKRRPPHLVWRFATRIVARTRCDKRSSAPLQYRPDFAVLLGPVMGSRFPDA
jgi:hypothetical protein